MGQTWGCACAVCRAAVVLTIVTAAVLATACGEAMRDVSGGSPEPASIEVKLDEFAVIPEVDSFKAGRVRFAVENAGSADHTFSVIRTDLAFGRSLLDDDV